MWTPWTSISATTLSTEKQWSGGRELPPISYTLWRSKPTSSRGSNTPKYPSLHSRRTSSCCWSVVMFLLLSPGWPSTQWRGCRTHPACSHPTTRCSPHGLSGSGVPKVRTLPRTNPRHWKETKFNKKLCAVHCGQENGSLTFAGKSPGFSVRSAR